MTRSLLEIHQVLHQHLFDEGLSDWMVIGAVLQNAPEDNGRSRWAFTIRDVAGKYRDARGTYCCEIPALGVPAKVAYEGLNLLRDAPVPAKEAQHQHVQQSLSLAETVNELETSLIDLIHRGAIEQFYGIEALTSVHEAVKLLKEAHRQIFDSTKNVVPSAISYAA